MLTMQYKVTYTENDNTYTHRFPIGHREAWLDLMVELMNKGIDFKENQNYNNSPSF